MASAKNAAPLEAVHLRSDAPLECRGQLGRPGDWVPGDADDQQRVCTLISNGLTRRAARLSLARQPPGATRRRESAVDVLCSRLPAWLCIEQRTKCAMSFARSIALNASSPNPLRIFSRIILRSDALVASAFVTSTFCSTICSTLVSSDRKADTKRSASARGNPISIGLPRSSALQTSNW